ncbi:MAG: Zn-dependent exopeptidase M28 [Clostridia bacterium]|nr:Zn-dependent exopeptidase M28 [Clostridia bacterium]
MKPQDCVKNYTSDRRMYANFVARNIKKICKEIGPRPSGTEKELAAQEYMKAELETSCDEVSIEPFSVHPSAFMGWVQVCVICGVISSALLFLTHFFPAFAKPFLIAATVLMVIGLFSVITEFLFYKETLDPFFPKKTSHNVIAVRKASGETKRRIIFSGHADSAPEWRFTYWGGPKLVVPAIGGGLLGFVLTVVFSVIALVFEFQGKFEGNKVIWILSIISICFVPLFLFCLLFYNPKRYVDGANDNLTGCLCSMAVPRFMQDNDIRFENTEVMVVCTGSEESGLRGAKAFVKAHKAEFDKEEGVETIFFGLDTVRDYDFMAVYNKDMTGTVRNDAEVSNLIREGGKLAGLDLPYRTVTLGSSDAAAITKGGMKGACFAAMDPAPARYYHTRLDTADNLDLKTIEAGVDLVLQTAFLYDEKGLDV